MLLTLLAVVGTVVSASSGVQVRRGLAVHRGARGIPAALARAIHARLGPGPIGLGHAPLISGIGPAGGGWQAKAPAHSLTARITLDGTVIAHLHGTESVSLRPVALSSGAQRAALSVSQTSPGAGRLVQRLGPATSAYAVTAGGVEQRFMINRPLSGSSELALAFSSSVRWRSFRAGSGIVPTGVHAGRLAYAGLRVTDVRGRVLPAHFALTGGGGPEIVIDTRGAGYPVTIDPTWTTTSTPTATLNDTLSGGQGVAVALSQDGTTALVGSARAAYIYRASSEGSWSSSSTPTATLTVGSLSSVSGYDLDSSVVALSSDGTTALMGADGVNGYDGAAYVFHVSSEGSWSSSSTPTATLTDGSGTEDFFGFSVALSSDGTSALIGALIGSSGKGAAYVFHASSEGAWSSSSTPTATLTNSAGAAHDWLGYSVALSSDGTTALVGAPDVSSSTGAAYIFHVASEGSWASSSTPTATLTDDSEAAGDDLGGAVALSSDGSTALIGAPSGNNAAGAACVFHASAEGSWSSSSTPTATLTGGGASVALSADGTTALIGAVGFNSSTGAAYVFHASSEGSWASSSTPTATLTRSSGASGDGLAASVAISSDGTTALIGAPGVGGELEEAGAAYVFHSSSEGSWSSSSTPAATLSSPTGPTLDDVGYSVALSSDGTTALIGSPGPYPPVANGGLAGYGPGPTGAGEAYVFHVSSEGSWSSSSTPTATLTNSSGGSDDGLGNAVALSPDGTTALIGAPGVNNSAGAAYVFHVASEGSWASSSTPTATLTHSSGASGDTLGGAVAVSRDGTTALIGAPGAGAAYVFHASAEGSWSSSSTPTATLTGGGASVALSSDGTTALIGAPGLNSSTGAAHVFHTSSEGSWASSSTPTATLTNSSGASGDALGGAVAISSDGTTALIGADGVTAKSGAAYIFHASSEGSWSSSSTPTATLTDSAGHQDDQLGDSVAISSDGTTALIGAPNVLGLWAFNVFVGAHWGGAFVFQAASEGSWSSSSTPTATLTNGSGAVFDGLGGAVALSSDGTIALVGAPEFGSSSPTGAPGAAHIFSTSSGPSLSVTVPSSGTVGSPIAASSVSGVLSRGSSPTGTISFRVFGPQASPPSSCTSGGSPVGSAVSVTGNGTYNPSTAFTPGSVGDYWWYASYGGDMNNDPLSSACGAAMAETVVTTAKAGPSLSVRAPAAGSVGSPIAAASVSGVLSGGSAPTGSISFRVFGPQATAPSSCSSGGSPVGTSVSVTGNRTYSPSAAFTPESAGDYWWYATYAGDSGNNPTASACGLSMAKTIVTGTTPPAGVPVDTVAPVLGGTALSGSSLTCSRGTWTNSASSFRFQWLRNGIPIPGATGPTYLVRLADENEVLSCGVIASNSHGAGKQALSRGVHIAFPKAHCPVPSGSISGTHLGPLALGMTQQHARALLPRYTVQKFQFDDFCLHSRFGIRAKYANSVLLHSAPTGLAAKTRGRIVIALTSCGHYRLVGVKSGNSLAANARRLHVGKRFRVGKNDWYLLPFGAQSDGVLKVRGNKIIEVGIADTRFLLTAKAQRFFFLKFVKG